MPPKKHDLRVKGTVDSGPARQVAKKVAVPTSVLDAAFGAALSHGPASSIKIGSAKSKRKPDMIVDDSDIEILEHPANPSPSKKAKKVSTSSGPAAMSKGKAAAVSSFLDKIDAAMAKSETVELSTGAGPTGSLRRVISAEAKTPVFVDTVPEVEATNGSVVTLSPAPVILSPAGRPVRSKSLTEKARVKVAEDAAADLKKKRKTLFEARAVSSDALHESPAGLPKSARKVVAAPSTDNRARDPSEDSELPDVLSDTDTVSLFQASVGARARGARLPVSDDEDEDPPVFTSAKASNNENPFLDLEADVGGNSDGNSTDDGSVRSVVSQGTVSVGSSEGSPDAVDKESDPDAIMQPDLWHPAMVEGYLTLPKLRKFYDVAPYTSAGQHTDMTTFRVPVIDMMRAIPQAIGSLAAGLTFVQSNTFINTARVDPRALAFEGGRIKLAGSGRNATCVMIGMVTESMLFHTAYSGSQSSQFEVHRITIGPAPQEMRRDTSLWGQLLEFPQDVIVGPAGPLGFSFTTFPKTNGARSTSTAPPSPKTPPKFKYGSSILSPSATGSVSTGSSFGFPVRFEDTVPVFYGREAHGLKPFLFTDKDFSTLSSRPRYRGNVKEIPDESIVAVGYGVGLYISKGASANKYLSSNIFFVIILGTPSDVPKELDQGEAGRGKADDDNEDEDEVEDE
ncbi:hypothetical protein FPV67DRAFT_1665179 [Lyophyllum atratum]|nr:hypothetical protein FPV67DRAFT_1665179 [Lyophyllum atratum]